MTVRAIDIVNKFAPAAKQNYRTAFENGDALLAQYGVTTPKRLAHFMAQVFHESGALTLFVENGRYTAGNLANMWDQGNWHRYFDEKSQCTAMSVQCAADGGEALFNRVYGNRMGNGPPESGDGWKYRGRGLLQTTGRESYRKFGRLCGIDFEADPDLIVAPEHALKPALGEWDAGHLNAAADAGDIEVITKRINGRYVGLDERRAWFAKIYPFARGGNPVEQSIEWRVQAKLNALRYKYVDPDGVVGKNTRTAILDYTTKHGLKVRPKITPELVQSLGL